MFIKYTSFPSTAAVTIQCFAIHNNNNTNVYNVLIDILALSINLYLYQATRAHSS